VKLLRAVGRFKVTTAMLCRSSYKTVGLGEVEVILSP